MSDRVDLLEERVAGLASALAALDARLAALERRPGSAEPIEGAEAGPGEAAAAPRPAVRTDADEGPGAVVLAGRGLLGLGGGYLIRALTEGGTLPPVAGVAAGLAYGVAWIVAADRRGRSGRAAEATLDGAIALAVALPLLWEATVRLRVVGPAAAAALLAAIGAAVFTVAWRRDLLLVAWAATLGSVGAAWALLFATTRIELFTLLLIAFGAGTLWTTYGRRWHALRWPAALAADLAVLAIVFLGSLPGGPPEAWSGFRAGRAVFVALLLFVVYAGSFAARTLARQRGVNVFEAVQTGAVLLVGYLGAVRLARAVGSGEAALGIAALLLSALAYAAAFGFVSRDSAGARNFLFFSSVALLLGLTSGSLLANGPALALTWGAFGFAGSALGARFDRRSLVAHGAVYLVAAGIPSGLFEAAAAAFPLGRGVDPIRLGPVPAAVALASVVAFVLVVRARKERASSAGLCAAPTVLLAVAAAGAGAAAVGALLLALPPSAETAARTAVLAAAAVGLAWLRARSGVVEPGWLAWSVLALAALRICVRDLPGGSAATLFAAFVGFGLALIAVSRLMKREKRTA